MHPRTYFFHKKAGQETGRVMGISTVYRVCCDLWVDLSSIHGRKAVFSTVGLQGCLSLVSVLGGLIGGASFWVL